MSRLAFLFLLLMSGCLGVLPCHAQRPSIVSLNDSAAQIARDDTAMALQRLFQLRRHTSVRSGLIGIVLAGATAYSLANHHPETTYQRAATVGLTAAGGYGLFQMIAGAVQRWRYRARQEERLLDRLDRAQPLPHWVGRKLTPSYFGAQALSN